jgi:hypothetical protein
MTSSKLQRGQVFSIIALLLGIQVPQQLPIFRPPINLTQKIAMQLLIQAAKRKVRNFFPLSRPLDQIKRVLSFCKLMKKVQMAHGPLATARNQNA